MVEMVGPNELYIPGYKYKITYRDNSNDALNITIEFVSPERLPVEQFQNFNIMHEFAIIQMGFKDLQKLQKDGFLKIECTTFNIVVNTNKEQLQ